MHLSPTATRDAVCFVSDRSMRTKLSVVKYAMLITHDYSSNKMYQNILENKTTRIEANRDYSV